MVDDTFTCRLLDFGEEGSGQRPFKAPAVDTQYTFHLYLRSCSICTRRSTNIRGKLPVNLEQRLREHLLMEPLTW
jgi:hypothetical protein